MTNEYRHKEEVAESLKETASKTTSEKKKRSKVFVQLLNGEFLAKEFVLNNLNYIFFFIFLLILLVAKGYYAKQLTKDIDLKSKELDAMTAEYVEAKAKLEEETKRIELIKQLGPKGLKESTQPAKVIRIKEKK
jgi:hypothetical protein